MNKGASFGSRYGPKKTIVKSLDKAMTKLQEMGQTILAAFTAPSLALAA